MSHHASRLAEVFKGLDVPVDGDVVAQGEPGKGSATLIRDSLAEGWSLPLGDSTLHLLTDAGIMGREQRSVRCEGERRPRVWPRCRSWSPAATWWHMEHGIGRFVGTRHMGGEESEKEYLVLEYAAGDKLYVPTDQPGQVSPVRRLWRARTFTHALGDSGVEALQGEGQSVDQRVGRATIVPLRLSRGGGRVCLLSRYAVAAGDGGRIPPTRRLRDQMESIHEVKRDMEHHKPMDRLVCGDVGYGKTEVALRAAFKAVMDGAQVAFLVPTTILAHQHYVTFSERLATFPIRVEVLSRFRTQKSSEG